MARPVPSAPNRSASSARCSANKSRGPSRLDAGPPERRDQVVRGVSGAVIRASLSNRRFELLGRIGGGGRRSARRPAAAPERNRRHAEERRDSHTSRSAGSRLEDSLRQRRTARCPDRQRRLRSPTGAASSTGTRMPGGPRHLVGPARRGRNRHTPAAAAAGSPPNRAPPRTGTGGLPPIRWPDSAGSSLRSLLIDPRRRRPLHLRRGPERQIPGAAQHDLHRHHRAGATGSLAQSILQPQPARDRPPESGGRPASGSARTTSWTRVALLGAAAVLRGNCRLAGWVQRKPRRGIRSTTGVEGIHRLESHEEIVGSPSTVRLATAPGTEVRGVEQTPGQRGRRERGRLAEPEPESAGKPGGGEHVHLVPGEHHRRPRAPRTPRARHSRGPAPGRSAPAGRTRARLRRRPRSIGDDHRYAGGERRHDALIHPDRPDGPRCRPARPGAPARGCTPG